MSRYLEDLKKKQNKEEVLNRRQAKKRTEVLDRLAETETPNKVKKVEVEIAGKNDKQNENIGEYICGCNHFLLLSNIINSFQLLIIFFFCCK